MDRAQVARVGRSLRSRRVRPRAGSWVRRSRSPRSVACAKRRCARSAPRAARRPGQAGRAARRPALVTRVVTHDTLPHACGMPRAFWCDAPHARAHLQRALPATRAAAPARPADAVPPSCHGEGPVLGARGGIFCASSRGDTDARARRRRRRRGHVRRNGTGRDAAVEESGKRRNGTTGGTRHLPGTNLLGRDARSKARGGVVPAAGLRGSPRPARAATSLRPPAMRQQPRTYAGSRSRAADTAIRARSDRCGDGWSGARMPWR
jgi:hypothetical protein